MTETDKIGRPVRITSISFANGRTRDEVFALVDREGARGTDLIALPETFLGQAADNSTMEALDGPTVKIGRASCRERV